MDKLDKAVIIHGPGRSGTTLLGSVLSLHPDFAWISNYVDRWPSQPWLTMLNNLNRVRSLESHFRGTRLWPRPAEAFGFWNHYIPGFFEASNREIPAELSRGCIAAIRRLQNWSNGSHFITKITGTSRRVFLEAIFEEPIIVYIDRDPRAVVASYYKQRWGHKHRPELFTKDREQMMLIEYTKMYLGKYETKSELKRFRFVQVYYEDLVADFQSFFGDLLSRLGMEYPLPFRQVVESWASRVAGDRNTAWRRKFSPGALEVLESRLRQPMSEMGYE